MRLVPHPRHAPAVLLEAPHRLHAHRTRCQRRARRPRLPEGAVPRRRRALRGRFGQTRDHAQRRLHAPVHFLALHWNGGLDAKTRTELFEWIGAVRASRFAPKGLSPEVASGPVHPLPASLKTDPRKVALGEKLYFDKRLSGDDTVSCASCHDLGKGGTDQDKVSTGIRGQKGGINAPTTFNAALQFMQFWDGRAPNLQAQAGGPPQNPIEMGSDWKTIPAKLAKDAAFAAKFRAVYPSGLDQESITDADNGRWSVTKSESDRHRFKVPTLRNVARTAPYFHDASAADLASAVDSMARYQLGTRLSAGERDAIVKFLEALTGEFRGKPL